MGAAECECSAVWGCTGGIAFWASFKIHLEQRSSFRSVSMKVAVANSSEMKGGIQISSYQHFPEALCQCIFFQCHFLEPLASFRDHKDGFEMFGVADFQNVCIASRKDLIARLPLRLRLRPANMI